MPMPKGALTRRQLNTLITIYNIISKRSYPVFSAIDLVHETGEAYQTIYMRLKRMEKSGLVKRVAHGAWTLTDKGRRAVEQAVKNTGNLG